MDVPLGSRVRWVVGMSRPSCPTILRNRQDDSACSFPLICWKRPNVEVESSCCSDVVEWFVGSSLYTWIIKLKSGWQKGWLNTAVSSPTLLPRASMLNQFVWPNHAESSTLIGARGQLDVVTGVACAVRRSIFFYCEHKQKPVFFSFLVRTG